MAGEVHQARLLTNAVVAQLSAAGLAVGDGEAPAAATAGQVAGSGYVVVYPLVGGSADGDLAAPDEDARVPYQLTSVGATREQCEWVADKVRATVLAAIPTVANRKIIAVETDMVGGTLRDGGAEPPVFYSPTATDTGRHRYEKARGGTPVVLR